MTSSKYLFSEQLCYLLNLRGRKVQNIEPDTNTYFDNASPPERYIKTYDLKKARLDYYSNQAGTFLKRYSSAVKYLESEFPKSFFRNKTVLEIGSGRGPFVLVLARELGAKYVYGVEIEKNSAEFSLR